MGATRRRGNARNAVMNLRIFVIVAAIAATATALPTTDSVVSEVEEMLVEVEQWTPASPGCWLLTPSGCPKQNSLMKNSWIQMSKQANAKMNAHRRLLGSDPKPVATPYVVDLKGPNSKAWYFDFYGMNPEFGSSYASKEACERRTAAMNTWCGVTDSKFHFNANTYPPSKFMWGMNGYGQLNVCTPGYVDIFDKDTCEAAAAWVAKGNKFPNAKAFQAAAPTWKGATKNPAVQYGCFWDGNGAIALNSFCDPTKAYNMQTGSSCVATSFKKLCALKGAKE